MSGKNSDKENTKRHGYFSKSHNEGTGTLLVYQDMNYPYKLKLVSYVGNGLPQILKEAYNDWEDMGDATHWFKH